jgi:pyruvate/2-oxoacid:ferredoxin oxidoreductase alpha subunit
MAEAMGVSLKTENEEYAGKTMQIRGSEGGRRGFTVTSMQGFSWRVPR